MKYSVKNILSVIIVVTSFCTLSQAQTIVPDSLKEKQSLKNIAYGVQPEWQVTGSISSVKGDALTKSFTSNVATTLYGRLPGLVAEQGGGEAGSDAPSLHARGLNTFGSGSGMYIVIDGLPSTEAFFQQLTPQEIESVSLLKDASATAIYGDRAANGVLLVTTKRGIKAPFKANFSVQYGLQQPTRLPDFLGSYDYARLYNEALVNDGEMPKYSDADLTAYRDGSDPIYHPDVNWYKELLRGPSPLVNYNFNASGGSETVKYFVLFNVVDNNGIYKKTEDEFSEFTKNESYLRYNFRTNVDVTLSNRLSAMVTLGGTVEDKTNPGVDENTNNVFNLMASLPPNAFPVLATPERPGGNALYANPWSDITQRGYVSYNGRAAQISAKLLWDLGMITPGLSIAGTIGFNTYFKSFSKKTRNYARFSAVKDTAGVPVYTQFGQNTSLAGSENDSYQWRNTAFQGFLNYDRTFGIHGINAMVMANYDDNTESNNYNDASRNTILPYKNIGMGGRFTYSLDKRYIGEFSFGYTGNDNFAPGKRFGFFPAGSLGWVASNEEFLKGNAVVSFLKIRGSYGLTGNSDIGSTRFMYNQYYNWSGYNLGTDNGGRSALVQGPLANPDATWEKEKKLNVGFETTLFKNLNVSFDFFKHNRYDILAKPYSTVPDYLGINLPDMNVGKVENKGFEATFGYISNQTKDLTYFVEASGWFANNRIDFNAETPQLYDYLYSTGHSVGQPFLLQAIGFFKDQEDIDNSPRQIFTDVQPGDIKYKNQNDDNVIDQSDYSPIGYTSMPQLTLGLHTGVADKGFDLDLFFQGALNRSVYFSGKYFQAFQNDGQISSIALGRWTSETASTATYPRLSSKNNLNNYQPSSFWQKNGDFMKLRSLEIGYSLPNNILERVRMEKVRIFLNGTNLFSLDHMDGLTDPETVSGGVGYPVQRTISLGLNIQI